MQEFPTKTISFGGFKFLYRVLIGEVKKSPVLFLSGAFQSMGSWKRFIPTFHPDTSVILADLPGMGAADSLPESYGLDFYADCVVRLLDEIKVPKVSVMAASYGALMGYRFAQLYPDRVEQLALAGIMWKVSRTQREDAFAHVDQLPHLSPDDYATEVIDRLLTPIDRDKVERAKLVERVLRTELKRLDEDGIEKYRANMLRLITQPPLDVDNPPRVRTLIFTGEYDHFTRPRYGRALGARMEDCRFVVIGDADHLCHMERFETATTLVRRFFDSNSLNGIEGCKSILRFGRAVQQ